MLQKRREDGGWYDRVVDNLIPRTRKEKGWFAFSAVTVGISEEIVFHGFVLLLLSTGNGSSTGNDTQFIVEYSILNTSDHREMPLKTGDVIDTTVVNDDGSVDIQVENSAGGFIYSETDVPTSEFEIVISQDDTYTFTVTGHKAKGSVSFIKS